MEYSKEKLMTMIGRWTKRVPKTFKIITDTTNFIQVDFHDVVILGERPYLIGKSQKEGRFGIDDEPKYWVKSATDLVTGETKIIKMVFHEQFKAKIGDITFDCVRSPRKEARILNTVRGHANFMQGHSVNDSAGNNVRVIDYIKGQRLDKIIEALDINHEEYFFTLLKDMLDKYIELVQAIHFLHSSGEKHGDIRRDHILKAAGQDRLVWIDFDYNYSYNGKENIYGYDLFGLGNVLCFLVGCGDVIYSDIKTMNPSLADRITAEDRNIVFNNRVVNLKKVYPYIPDSLNLILLHFSSGAKLFYPDTNQFLNQLREAREQIF